MGFSKDFSLQVEIGGPVSHQKDLMTHFLPVRLQSGDVDPSFPLPNCPAPLGALGTARLGLK